MGNHFYIRRGEKTVGPKSLAELRKLEAASRLLPSDWVAQSDQGPWHSLADVHTKLFPQAPDHDQLFKSTAATSEESGNRVFAEASHAPRATPPPNSSTSHNGNLTTCPDCNGIVSRKAASCPQCGSPLNETAKEDAGVSTTDEQPSRLVAILLAFFLGMIGGQWFYLKNTNKAIIYLVGGTIGWLVVVPPIVVGVLSIIEAITWLGWSDKRFNDKFGDTFNKY